MVDLKNFLDVNKLKGLLGKKDDSSSSQGEKTENIKVSEDKIDQEIDDIEKSEGKGGGEPVPFFKDRKKLIRAFIILGIIYFAADQFLMTPEQPQENQDSPAANPVRKKRVRPDAASATTTETASTTVAAEATPAPESTGTPGSQVGEIPIAPTPLAEATLAPEPTPAPETTLAPETTPAPEATLVAEPSPAPSTAPEAPLADATPESTPLPSMTIEKDVAAPLGETIKPKDDLGSKLSDIVSTEVTPSPKKMDVKEYVAPPSYNMQGRGLVYNCKGRHWACVDKDSYLLCKQNEIWQKKKGKALECSAINVYSTTDDCKIVQIHNVNTAAKTDFCK